MSGTTSDRFFWNDWLGDPNLRACSAGARGVWIDMLCLAAMSPRRGYVLLAGLPPTNAQFSRLFGETEGEIERCLAELENNKVFSKDRGTIYCRRMVRDAKRVAASAKGGRKGGRTTYERQTGIYGTQEDTQGDTQDVTQEDAQDVTQGRTQGVTQDATQPHSARARGVFTSSPYTSSLNTKDISLNGKGDEPTKMETAYADAEKFCKVLGIDLRSDPRAIGLPERLRVAVDDEHLDPERHLYPGARIAKAKGILKPNYAIECARTLRDQGAPRSNGAQKYDDGEMMTVADFKALTDAKWRLYIKDLFRESEKFYPPTDPMSHWLPIWGEIGTPGCIVPENVLKEFPKLNERAKAAKGNP